MINREIFPKTATLTLTAEDMNGYYGSNTDCPLARACKRWAKCNDNDILVGSFDVDFYNEQNKSIIQYTFDTTTWGKHICEGLRAQEEFKGYKIVLKRVK